MSCFYLALLYYLISFHSVVVFVVTLPAVSQFSQVRISLWVVVLTNNLKFAVYQIVAGWIPI